MRIQTVNPELWYDIPGYEWKYQINYFAQIRRALRSGEFKMLNPYKKSCNGRIAIKLNCKERDVMSLMRDTFFGEIPEGCVMYHKNGLITDNELGNLGITTRKELGKLSGKWNGCSKVVVKISPDGEIVDYYKSVREAGRKNHMSYQTILDRMNGKTKSLFAPDGYVYVKDKDCAVQKAIRAIELDNIKECGCSMVKAPEVVFDF